MPLLRLHVLANLLPHLVDVRELAEFLGEVIVHLRQILLLDGMNLHRVHERLARKPLVRRVFGIRHFECALFAGGCAAQVLGELWHGVFAPNLDEDFVHVHRLCVGRVISILRLAIHGSLGEVALRQRASFHRRERRVLLANTGERLLDFVIADCDLGFVGAQFLVAFDGNLRHHFEAGLEPQWFAVMNVQIGDSRLRNRNHAELLGLFAEVARNQRLDNIALQIFFEPLPDDGRRHVPAPKAWQARHLLILLDDGLSLASDGLRRNLHGDLALDAVFLDLVAHITWAPQCRGRE